MSPVCDARSEDSSSARGELKGSNLHSSTWQDTADNESSDDELPTLAELYAKWDSEAQCRTRNSAISLPRASSGKNIVPDRVVSGSGEYADSSQQLLLDVASKPEKQTTGNGRHIPRVSSASIGSLRPLRSGRKRPQITASTASQKVKSQYYLRSTKRAREADQYPTDRPTNTVPKAKRRKMKASVPGNGEADTALSIFKVRRLLARWQKNTFLLEWIDGTTGWEPRANILDEEMLAKFEETYQGFDEGVAVLRSRMKRGRKYYLLHWNGRPQKENSWVREEAMSPDRLGRITEIGFDPASPILNGVTPESKVGQFQLGKVCSTETSMTRCRVG